jgi:hypothetical protein
MPNHGPNNDRICWGRKFEILKDLIKQGKNDILIRKILNRPTLDVQWFRTNVHVMAKP